MKTIALLGNPNVGKTTLFNALTGSNQYVGNWAGVTVEKKEGYLGKDIKIVDLPGIYAMDTFSNEEKVSKQFLTDGNVDLIVNIVDGSKLERNLYLTSQLTQFNKPILLIVNMIDVAKTKGIDINFHKLSKELGVTIMPISASKGTGIETLKNFIEKNDYNSLDLSINKKHNFLKMNEKETYTYIENLLKTSIEGKKDNNVTTTEKIDKIVLNKFLAYPIFLGLLFLIFKFTFEWVGGPLQEVLDGFVGGTLVSWIQIPLSNSSAWFQSLIIDGIIGGVGSVIVFLPIILALFLGITFLEDSGYMARAAFIMDKLMRKLGLSGKAFIPLIMGFGCSVPGIMAARTLESEKDRKLTSLIVPFMSCNARLPVYGLFTAALFTANEALVILGLYLLGISVAFIIALIFKNTLFKKDEEPFIIELPEYKLPELKSLLLHTWEKGKGFLKKAGTLIFSISVIVWFLSNFNMGGMTDINTSFLSSIGRFINPIFAPLGFASWENSVALLTGLMAKEVVVGTLGVLYTGDLVAQIAANFTTITGLSFLVFTLLYTPCVSVIATMKKEFGGKFALFSVVYQFVVAWIVAFLVYNVAQIIL
ncbi:ferrous iron transport protein B [Clostridium sp. UBA4548]|uniref:ferrous iron transport protein B n=1 Tax=Clostridium sp. UBA4548 TaxID=1946361 RepID=UPI0025C37717|nr:ferrous iron transport protein B [Clostridium sp. UBA4548]